jgi:hypothetical protein
MAATPRQQGYPERLPATVAQLIEDLDRAVPKVTIAAPITTGDVQAINFTAGQRSIVDQLVLMARKEGIVP